MSHRIKNWFTVLHSHWHSLSGGRKIIFAIVVGIVLLLLLIPVLIIGGLILILIVHQVDLHTQRKHFNQAVTRCGTQPVVIIETHALEETDVAMYTSINPHYGEHKMEVENPVDIFGGSFVAGYYCDAASALASKQAQLIQDDTQNYASVAEQKEAHLKSFSKRGGKLYDPDIGLPGYTIRKKVIDNSLNMTTVTYEAAVSRVPGAAAKQNIELVCHPGGSLDDLSYSRSRDQRTSGQNSYGQLISFSIARDSSDQMQYWDTKLPGSACELDTSDPNITELDGTKLMAGLHEISITSAIDTYDIDN